ncbi:DEAD/DEAH box helicase family protein [Helicobacter pylori]|nr:DEAD/DEAH box helicase family protein [Helicobacter pylori]
MQDSSIQSYPPPPQSAIKNHALNNAPNDKEIDLPTHITSNLKKELRDYQKKAIYNYLEKRQSHPTQKHFMFEMATGSGKTLVMAGLILECCKQGYQNFIFFVNTIIWEKKYSPQNDAKWFSDNHDFILLYAKDKGIWRPNLLPRTSEMNARYKNLDNDERGAWKPSDCLVKTYMASYDYPITTPSGKIVTPPKGRCWMTSKENFQKLVDDNRIYFGRNGDNVPSLKRFLSEVKQGTTPLTIWKYTEVGHNQDATKQLLALFNNVKLFDTPKPEALISRILEIATQENDLVLDFFAGSGTTCAVAHKMKRRYIGIEQMDYIETITKERLKKVIEGEQGGISKKCGFKGGGSFVYAELKEVNLEIKKQILNAKSADECLKIFNDLNERFLKRTDGKIDEIHSEEFQKLDLNEQKRKCCDLLDSNEDYLNLGDIDEDAWGIDKITKKYNEIFYS